MASSTLSLRRGTLDISGKQFGRLFVLGPIPPVDGSGRKRWACHCDCGSFMVARSGELRRGDTTSCGCAKKAALTTHGQSIQRTRSYTTWDGMIQRCTNPRNKKYHLYGGRGILVCEPWLTFEQFFADMGERPEGLTIDRINPDGNYEPSNCRWATAKEQNRNLRTNIMLTHDGETLTIAEWTERTKLGRNTIWGRLQRGWSSERAITEPPQLNQWAAGKRAP